MYLAEWRAPERAWGTCRFDIWKSKQGSPWGRGISERRSDESWCQRMLRNNAAFLLYLQLQYTENPSFACFSLFFINSGVKVSYELKQIPTLVPHVDWILASVLCHLNARVEVLLLWELHSLHKAHTHTHTHNGLLGWDTTTPFSPRNTLLRPWVVTIQAAQIKLDFS